MTPEHKKILKALYLEHNKKKYPSTPDECRPNKYYNDKTANGLTTCIKDFLNNSGWQAERISVTGRRVDNLKGGNKPKAFGLVTKFGKTIFIKSTMTKGSADISATIKGKSVKIEVKIGSDTIKKDQTEYKKNIENAGGIYFIAKSFADFYEKYLLII